MKEAVKTLQKWTDSWVIGKTEYMWDGGSDEDLDVVHASLRTVLAALDAANARADEYEQLFEMRRQAERRGIEMWRSEKPGRELREPDSANFTMWLLNRIEFDETVFAELRERAERAEAALQHAKKGLLSVHECGSGGCSECPRVADECLGEVEMIEAQTTD